MSMKEQPVLAIEGEEQEGDEEIEEVEIEDVMEVDQVADGLGDSGEQDRNMEAVVPTRRRRGRRLRMRILSGKAKRVSGRYVMGRETARLFAFPTGAPREMGSQRATKFKVAVHCAEQAVLRRDWDRATCILAVLYPYAFSPAEMAYFAESAPKRLKERYQSLDKQSRAKQVTHLVLETALNMPPRKGHPIIMSLLKGHQDAQNFKGQLSTNIWSRMQRMALLCENGDLDAAQIITIFSTQFFRGFGKRYKDGKAFCNILYARGCIEFVQLMAEIRRICEENGGETNTDGLVPVHFEKCKWDLTDCNNLLLNTRKSLQEAQAYTKRPPLESYVKLAYLEAIQGHTDAVDRICKEATAKWPHHADAHTLQLCWLMSTKSESSESPGSGLHSAGEVRGRYREKKKKTKKGSKKGSRAKGMEEEEDENMKFRRLQAKHAAGSHVKLLDRDPLCREAARSLMNLASMWPKDLDIQVVAVEGLLYCLDCCPPHKNTHGYNGEDGEELKMKLWEALATILSSFASLRHDTTNFQAKTGAGSRGRGARVQQSRLKTLDRLEKLLATRSWWEDHRFFSVQRFKREKGGPPEFVANVGICSAFLVGLGNEYFEEACRFLEVGGWSEELDRMKSIALL